MMHQQQATALVLAAKRDGALDPLAAAAGVSHKCLVPVAGRPMLVHPIEALAASPAVGKILVSIDNPAVLDAVGQLQALRSAGRLEFVPARANLVDSISEAAKRAAFPLLVTTADNVLLTRQALQEFVARAIPANADAAVAFSRRESVLAAHPDGQRRFYRFGEGSYSNCNTYWIRSFRALQVAEIFRSGGQFAKHPIRIAGAFGLSNLIRFRFGIGTLAAAFERLSGRFGIVIKPLILSDGSVAIDVDNARTLAVAESILLDRTDLPQAAE